MRTREAIVNALLALVEEGTPAPTAAQVAERAGVALRSIGQHFPTREELFAAAAAVHGQRAAESRSEVDPSWSLADRLKRFASARAKALESTAGLRKAIGLLQRPSPVVVEAVRRTAEARRTDVTRAFAPELAARRGHARAALLDSLDLLASGRVWDGLRDQGLSPAAAEKRLRALLAAVLASSLDA